MSQYSAAYGDDETKSICTYSQWTTEQNYFGVLRLSRWYTQLQTFGMSNVIDTSPFSGSFTCPGALIWTISTGNETLYSLGLQSVVIARMY